MSKASEAAEEAMSRAVIARMFTPQTGPRPESRALITELDRLGFRVVRKPAEKIAPEPK